MANNGPTGKTEFTAPDNNEAWDEEHLELALDELKLLHMRLRGLRTTIPRMIQPLSAKDAKPQEKFEAVMASVATAKKEVQDFQDHRKTDAIAKIMEHAEKRRKEEPDGIKPWRATDHPDWTVKDS
ncbi:hypothetical protein CCHL11_08093 [Colletotrichum chlorophyti]|uniref:Uncharacterized protein n=1 Tax=Colletotrichum chlorophyti TaxID=708187 RepID=A0A1Q8RMH8_9PEZI|nr:hypothetical protein CCHL11_08093 [Colletotrichum chlorophyti]